MEKPLMHKGVLHGIVTKEYDGKLEMDVHLDIKTGELLDNAKEIKDMGDYYEILL